MVTRWTCRKTTTYVRHLSSTPLFSIPNSALQAHASASSRRFIQWRHWRRTGSLTTSWNRTKTTHRCDNTLPPATPPCRGLLYDAGVRGGRDGKMMDGGGGDIQGKAAHSQQRTNTTGMDVHPNGNAQGGGGRNVPGLDLSRLASPFGFQAKAANRAAEGQHSTNHNNNSTSPSFAHLHTAVTQVSPYPHPRRS